MSDYNEGRYQEYLGMLDGQFGGPAWAGDNRGYHSEGSFQNMAKKRTKIKPKRKGTTVKVGGASLLKRSMKRYERNIILASQKIEELQDQLRFSWRSSDGRTYTRADIRGESDNPMTEEHLRNAISYCQRQLAWNFGSILYLGKTKFLVRALYEFLDAADERGFTV